MTQQVRDEGSRRCTIVDVGGSYSLKLFEDDMRCRDLSLPDLSAAVEQLLRWLRGEEN
jgi:hypothetical protein